MDLRRWRNAPDPALPFYREKSHKTPAAVNARRPHIRITRHHGQST
jgi:hypothetical protein